jgi:hypothetical protein
MSKRLGFPGSIDIWVNGVKWNQAVHNPTGCMSQYSVKPPANKEQAQHSRDTLSAARMWFIDRLDAFASAL